MSFKVFKNVRAARRYESSILLNLSAVDKQLKPCYLWDAFNADVTEIRQYLNSIWKSGLTSTPLKAFLVNETVFITRYDNMSAYSEFFGPENVDIVDVSKSNGVPSLLSNGDKLKILAPIKEIMRLLLSKILDICSGYKEIDNLDVSVNMTTLFGALLGYPVIYWYESQNPDIDFTCLSMVPLRVYSVSSDVDDNSNCDSNRDLISFSIPEVFCDKTARLVDSWFRDLLTKGRCCEFGDLKLIQRTVTLPCVPM